MNNQTVAQKPLVSDPKSSVKTTPSVARQARAAQILTQFAITKQAQEGQLLCTPFHTKVKMVSLTQVHDMIAQGVAGTKTSEVAIVDLRTPATPNKGDQYHLKLKGAFAIPFKDDSAIMRLRATKDSTNEEKAWKALQEMSNSPFAALATKPVIIVHCMASTSRTPAFVGGYVKHFGNRNGQQLLIMEGGFSKYMALYGEKPSTSNGMEARGELEQKAEEKVTQLIVDSVTKATAK